MSKWMKFNMKEEIKEIDFSMKKPENCIKKRNKSICEKCSHYDVRFRDNGDCLEICLAMPTMLETVAILKLFNDGDVIPFEDRGVPENCEFYAEQFISHLNNKLENE